MKRFAMIVLLVGVASLFVVNVVYAQGTQASTTSDADVVHLFTWASSDPPNWALGGLYAGLGFIGALVALFGLIGGAVPGTAGKVKIDKDTAQLERFSKRLEELVNDSESDAAKIVSVQKATDALRDDLRKEIWIQFSIASIFYMILGAFFASMLAQDILQAIVTGVGWTAALGTLGLKKDFEERKETKDQIIEKAESLAKEFKKTTDPNALSNEWKSEDIESFERDATLAKAL